MSKSSNQDGDLTLAGTRATAVSRFVEARSSAGEADASEAESVESVLRTLADRARGGLPDPPLLVHVCTWSGLASSTALDRPPPTVATVPSSPRIRQTH
jgi:hypothetical protein